MTARLGFVGLGQIGLPMARRLARWPGGLTAYDVQPDARARARGAGIATVDGLDDLAAGCDLVSVMVRDDAQVRDVVDQVLDAASSGVLVAVHSTVSSDTPPRLAELAAAHGSSVVDAPVSGGAVGAQHGALAVLVGGRDEDLTRCREPFSLLGTVVHAGPVGAGTRMKLARNLVHFVSFTAATEAQRLAEAAGLDLRVLGDVVRQTDAVTGGPGAIMHRETTAPLAADDFWHGVMAHVQALGEKDLDLVLDLAESLGVDLPLARLARERLAPGLGLPVISDPDPDPGGTS